MGLAGALGMASGSAMLLVPDMYLVSSRILFRIDTRLWANKGIIYSYHDFI